MAVSIFQIAGCLYTGVGAVDMIAEEVKKNALKKPILVTDKGVTKAGVSGKIEEALKAAKISYALYDGVVPNPTDTNVEECYAVYTKEKCDCIIAVGGGSVMDCAKGCGILTHGKDPINAYEGINQMKGPLPFYFAVATTAGTGSESTVFAVITTTKEDHPRKMVLYDARMLPHVAILDPALMVGMPPFITASTGCDALTHAVEGYISLGANEYTDAVALHGIKLINTYLRKAVANGNDLHAREKMAYGQTLAGIALSNAAVGSVHALAHPLSSFFNISHGDANSLMLPYVLRYCQIACVEKFVEIAKALDVHTHDMTPIEAADAAIAAIQRLTSDVGIPPTITALAKARNLKVDKKHIPAMAKDGMKDVCTLFNPRVPKLEDYIALYEEAWG